MFDDETKRIAYFLIGCMGSRSLFVYLAYSASPKMLLYMGCLATIVALGFFYSYMRYKTTDTGAFGGKVWWNDLRLVHSVLYGLFAYNAITGRQRMAWIILFADVFIGFVSFLYHYRFKITTLLST